MSGDDAVTVVLGALKDIHNLGLMILSHALGKAGFEIVNAGAALEQEDFINAAIETDARAILVSSTYGHAQIDADGFRERCIEAGIGDILLYIGGNLTVTRHKQRWEDIEATFKASGFDRAYPQEVVISTVIADLRADLAGSRALPR
jgi:methylaspartate mutase sigma subunit